MVGRAKVRFSEFGLVLRILTRRWKRYLAAALGTNKNTCCNHAHDHIAAHTSLLDS